jgi:hypothetical protein
MAAIPSSITSFLSVGRGKFWGWNVRPEFETIRPFAMNLLFGPAFTMS